MYLYGRMPVRVQLGTIPEARAKRLEVIAKGKRYTIANFIKLFEVRARIRSLPGVLAL